MKILAKQNSKDKTKESKVQEKASQVSTATKAKKESTTNKTSKTERKIPYIPIAILIILILVVLLVVFYVIPQYLQISFLQTSFSTFKSNFNSAQRIAVVTQYTNATQYNIISQCSTDIISAETVSDNRNASTIDFYVLNSTSCTYAPNGLGHVLNPVTTNASSCENEIKSEPSISLNYSSYNHTIITPYHMYVYGNDQYFSSCPVAVGLI